MSHESNITRSIGTRQNFVDGAIARRDAERFLANGNEGNISCESCALAGLCGAVGTALLAQTGSRIPSQDIDLIEAHGIRVSRNRSQVCPEKMVRAELVRTTDGEYWLAQEESLRNETVTLQAADALSNAVSAIVGRLASGQRI